MNKYNKYFVIIVVMVISLLTVACEDQDKVKIKYLESGKSYIKQKNYDKARVEFKNVLQIEPKTAEAHYLLGYIELEQENIQKAYSHFLIATQLDPQLLGPHLELGKSYLDYASLMKMNSDKDKADVYINNAKNHINKALQLAPENLDVQILQATLYAHQDNIEQAIRTLNRISQQDPQKTDAIILLVRLYIIQGDQEKAVKLLEKSASSSPDNEELQLELAKLYVLYGQIDQAISVMVSMTNRFPDSFTYYEFLVQYYIKNNELDEAENVLRNALSKDMSDVHRYISLLSFLEKYRNEDAVIRFLDSIYEQLSNDAVLNLWLANSYQKIKSYDNAISLYKNIINNQKSSKIINDAKIGMATIYLANNKPDKVKVIIGEILVENPTDSDALGIKGLVAMKEKDYETAVVCFNVILKTRPKSLFIIQHLAESYYFMARYSLAVDAYNRALEIAPNDVKLRLKLARALVADKKNDQALEIADNILQKDSSNVSVLIFKSEVLASIGRVEELTGVIDQIKQLMPDSTEGWFRMARLYKSQKNYQLAHKEIGIAWKKDPDSVDLLAELTDLEIKLGLYDLAKNRLKQLINSNPDHPIAYKYLGAVYLAQDNLVESESKFIIHMEKSPDDISIYRLLADIRIRNGDLDGAEAYYRKGLGRAPDDAFMKSSLEKLRVMQR